MLCLVFLRTTACIVRRRPTLRLKLYFIADIAHHVFRPETLYFSFSTDVYKILFVVINVMFVYVIIQKKLKQIAQLHGHTKRHGQVLDVHAKAS